MTVDLKIEAFFDTKVFGVPLVRRRQAVEDLAFVAIIGVADEETLQGYAVNATREIRFATADVRAGDLIFFEDGSSCPVLRADLVTDGAEMTAWLGRLRP